MSSFEFRGGHGEDRRRPKTLILYFQENFFWLVRWIVDSYDQNLWKRERSSITTHFIWKIHEHFGRMLFFWLQLVRFNVRKHLEESIVNLWSIRSNSLDSNGLLSWWGNLGYKRRSWPCIEHCSEPPARKTERQRQQLLGWPEPHQRKQLAHRHQPPKQKHPS